MNDEYYFRWLVNIVSVGNDIPNPAGYTKVLRLLYSVNFTWTLMMDGNRAEDGVELRHRYYAETGRTLIFTLPCSVLEMMVALADRCETHIMSDPIYGDRTGDWFWGMIYNLGLSELDDLHYDETTAYYIVRRLLDRTYKRNGEGGLFTVNNGKDLRKVEIWYQLGWYLNDILF